jgi:dihydroxy-acid dehydratase
MTKPAFENAIAVVMALGGSTNAVLHLLAIAHEARVDLELDDFNKVAARVPHIADMKPHGRFHMSDLDRVGGVPVVLQHLLEHGLLHGDVMTVSGKTMAESLADYHAGRPTARSCTRPQRIRSTTAAGIAVSCAGRSPPRAPS